MSKGFWRSPCGRFDRLFVEGKPPYYSVIDWDLGVRVRVRSVEEADTWVAAQQQKTASPLTEQTVAG